jgi:hypothetical protein
MGRNGPNKFGGYAQGNSGSGNYRGGKGRNAGTGGQGGKKSSSSVSPEVGKVVWLVAAIPVVGIVVIAAYFIAAATGGLNT